MLKQRFLVLPLLTFKRTYTSNMSRISDVVFKDHRELQDYYNKIKVAKDTDTAIRWQNQFVWELARHSVAEEIVVYPKFQKYLGDVGKSLAEKDRNEHQIVKDYLYKFQSLSPGQTEYIPTIDALMSNLQKHIEEEETEDFPQLESKLLADESKEMAQSFERTKTLVPTQSHPSAPNKPPFETVVGLLSAPLDKLQDLMKRWP
ncbi:cation binding protein [Schizosaccharomyces cryophilus OY26]|uniref:Cation binding protein n=1 Tax=Schizosaccharomyces cryophilus (strain OY26 / ATCC MYA-4695 / CBS 11777 / NBRC 106824 / NRRL Y48691) TaxID=653667 RepID=S9X7K5_SCHCR|nr:cation binding protein [Schizosaccharomyces cryophilus OY26]EPY53082.1 cation binding protein [Schizosaccharomyces cryophilus OY26]